MTASKSMYSLGWFSTLTASRLSSGSIDGGLGTAHEHRTPSISSRRSQWCRVALCSWQTKTPAFAAVGAGLLPKGSGVPLADRLARYLAKGSSGVLTERRVQLFSWLHGR